MEIKLGMHVCDIVSMTTAYCLHKNKWLQALTSSLFKLANGSTHGDETWNSLMRITSFSMTTTAILFYY